MVDPDATRASLFWKLQSSSDDVREIAWEEFHRLYAQTIRRFARRQGLADNQCDDVVQDVMLGFYSALPEFEYKPSRGRFRGYLKTCVCRCINRMRSKSKEKLLESEALDATADDLERVWDELWEQRLFELATAELTNGQSEQNSLVFRECVVDGKTPQFVAESMGMSVDAVYKARQRMVAEFKSILSRLVEDEP